MWSFGTGTRRHLIAGVAAALALSACAPTTNPATGRQEYTTLSPQDERAIGAREHPKILESFGGAYDDPELTAYVNRIGQRLAAQSEMPNLIWTFTVLDSPVINAFALPGGYVYITRGLAALANDEAELASVIGHEIGHVTARHTAQRQTNQTIAGLGAAAATIGAVLLGADPEIARGIGDIANTAGAGYVASYSRSQELEADALGVRYLTRLGYDPMAQADFLSALQASSTLQARIAGQQYDANRVDFLASHPATAERVSRAAALARDAGGGERERAAYLRVIDGVEYGDSGRQGLIRGQVFAHPDMRFRFEAPEGFKLKNSPNAVLAAGPSGAGVIFDASRNPGGSMRDYIAKRWVPALAKQTQVRQASDLKSLRIDGLEAAQVDLLARTSKGEMITTLTAIRSGDRVYRFTGLAPRGAPNWVQAATRDAALSFAQMSAREASRWRAWRIDVVNAGSVAQAASRTPFEDFAEERLRVLNGLTRGERTTADGRLKTIIE